MFAFRFHINIVCIKLNYIDRYGTRNIVVIGMMVFGATDGVSCIDLDLSKFYSSGDPPFRGGVRLALSLRP
jgi:hypothetical protein